ncbi:MULTISPECIES: hypothetical protein [unclassified Leifsonia]|uniref:hypothetical protein n=1 Tax=unclassified Leifsonia TaxID=2663824 RepID=UPI000A6DB76C|nr:MULTISPECIES: hypothetical protein [unclassified Leifsonia]
MTAGSDLVAQMNGALPVGAEWDERELALLSLAQRQADDIELLEKVLKDQGPIVTGSMGQDRLNPIFTEVRQGRQALAKILEAIKLPDEGLNGRVKDRKKVAAAERSWQGRPSYRDAG